LATAAVVTSGVIIAVCLGQTVFYGNRRLQNLEQATVAENLIFPDPTQVALLLEDATPGDKVLYFSGTYRDLYLSYGAYQLGAVYYPAIEGTAQEETWLSDESLSYVTASSPVYSLIGSDHGPNAWGRLYLRKIDGLDIVSQDMERLGDLRLDISNPGETFSITIDVMQHAQLQRSVEVTVPAGHEGWLDLPAECASATTLRLDLSHASREAYLAGLQNASGQTTLNWPWDQGIELVVTYRDGETDTMRFDTSRRFRTELYGREVQVLADRGSIVLAKILR
jgi:hypothetical protein